MKTFKQLQEEVLRYFDLAGEATDDPDGSDVELVKAALNQSNQNRSTEDKWKFMLSGVYTLNVVAGTQDYVLPHTDFNKLQYLWSDTYKRFVSSFPIREVPQTTVDFADSQFNEQPTFDFDGFAPVKVQPTSPDTLTMSSTQSETGSPSLYIEGEDEDGAAISESIDVDGTTTQEFAKITYVAKVGDFLGTMTLETTGGTELLVLTLDQYGKQYPVLKFHSVPVGNEVMKYKFYKAPRVMTRDYDLPNLPYPAANLLVWDSLLDLATYNELDSESVNLWRAKQHECLTNLYLYKLEGDVVGGVGEFINSPGNGQWE